MEKTHSQVCSADGCENVVEVPWDFRGICYCKKHSKQG